MKIYGRIVDIRRGCSKRGNEWCRLVVADDRASWVVLVFGDLLKPYIAPELGRGLEIGVHGREEYDKKGRVALVAEWIHT